MISMRHHVVLLAGLVIGCHAAAEPGVLTIDDLFRPAAVRHLELSPSGEYLAYFDEHRLTVGNPETGFSELRRFNRRLTITDLTWIGPRAVWVKSWDTRHRRWLGTAVRFGVEAGGLQVAAVKDHRNPGFIHDPLPDDDDRIVLARPDDDRDATTSELYRIEVFETLDKQVSRRRRVDTGDMPFYHYVADAAGDYVVGIRYVNKRPEVWRRSPGGEWQVAWHANDEATFSPQGLSADGRSLYVLTDATGDRVVAARFDLEERRIDAELYRHPRVDVTELVLDDDGNPVVAAYVEEGQIGLAFLDDAAAAEFDGLKRQFPGQHVLPVGFSTSTAARVVVVSSATNPGTVQLCRAGAASCVLVADVAPWMDAKALAPSLVLRAESTDDIVVEAYLTLPHDVLESIPLVAMPHGGPIGVSDDRYFSPDVQWLAANGYAVLQVNYRGSAGFGTTFEKAGLREWGRGIEDDVEAAVHAALEAHPQLDRERVGIFGGSYGGYSALMSVVRNPELFKCAASFAGVTDLPLLFRQTQTRDDSLRDALVRRIGDPVEDYAEQVEHSPVYRYADIRRPVLLGHGTDDDVVDYEHSWRLRMLLRLAGREPVFITLDGGTHGFATTEEAVQFYEPLLGFLDEHLKTVAD